jgi:hypothetical protein
MPTQEQVDQRVAEFQQQAPEALPDRLAWWVRILGIERARLFRLLGLSGSEAPRTSLTALPRIVAAHEDLAERVDDMLGHLLASWFDYDLTAFRTALHHPGSEGTHPSAPAIPLPYTPSPQVRNGLLLNMIVAGGPSALPALLAYLSETTTGQGRRGKRTG